MKKINQNKFREIIETLPDTTLTITTGLYTNEYKPMLKRASTIEEYISLLDKRHKTLNASLILKDLKSKKSTDRSTYNQIVDFFNEQKGNLKEKDYNMKTSKEVQKSYKNAIKDTDSFDNWNGISNGAEKERDHYFKLHPELKQDQKESLTYFLHKKLSISKKEAFLIENIVKENIKINKT